MDKPYAITLDVGSSLANRTGSWRVERPVYVDRLPPCSNACPAGESVQGWLYRAEEGDYHGAWLQLVEDNPLPAIMGRVCYHPCEDACNRVQLDDHVGINAVERFLGDEGLRRGWDLPQPPADSGKRVLVVGAGPSGLGAAYHLRRMGHAVTLVDAGSAPGGMLRYGIPKYRLPREILDAEVDRILALGVELRRDHEVTDLAETMRDGGFDGAFVAVGAQLGRRTYIPSGDTARVLDAISVLRSVEDGEPPQLGRRVAVYGGGNTALDAARTARRLGATEAVVVYRRTQERMPARAEEFEEAVAEGVRVHWLSTITRADQGHIVIEKMALDDAGFPQPTGEFEELAADSVLLALGQESDLGLLAALPAVGIDGGVVRVGTDFMTGQPGVFAGGDAVDSERTVTASLGHGKQAARHIDAWLGGRDYQPPPKQQLATAERLNTWYYSDAPRAVRPVLDAARRQSTFEEVVGGLDETNALYEARRCLSCGNCFECDNCYGVCPDNAVIKLGPGQRYAFDYDYCKGCGLCVQECPAGAIVMQPEPE